MQHTLHRHRIRYTIYEGNAVKRATMTINKRETTAMTYCDPTWWRCITAGKFMTQFPSQKPKNNSNNNNNNDTLTDFEQTVREREKETGKLGDSTFNFPQVMQIFLLDIVTIFRASIKCSYGQGVSYYQQQQQQQQRLQRVQHERKRAREFMILIHSEREREPLNCLAT